MYYERYVTMGRFVFTILLIIHGLAHISGFLSAWTTADLGYTDRPWLLSTGITLQSTVGRIFGLLWLVVAAGFVGVGLGLLFRQDWWPVLAVAAAAISLVVIVPWWRTVPPGAWAGAVFDVLVIIAMITPLKAHLLDLVG
ncbi:MAG: hypothetical protein JSW54_11120 [Fidelibacterota bacterium]|nr:MAG: hypothetical protein JSW54_11120 [Candidatus Neomarinimicrobiota bacterium]